VWITARFDVLLKSLNKNVSCTFPFFEKATKLFNATGHHACSLTPTKSFIDILLQAAKVWAKISVANFTKLFQSIFTVCG